MRVTLTGFGTFKVRTIGARNVRAIRGKQQGQLVSVPAHQRVGFRPGSGLQQGQGWRN
jgi:nucleoid DNA-binding protein